MSALLLSLLLSCGGQSAEDTATTPTAPWPDWTFRHWVWEDESTQESAIALVDGYLDRNIPVGAIIIDSPWETGYNTFEWDTDRFPDPQGMIDYLHSRDVRVMLWIVPGINTDVQPLYQEGLDAGYYMMDEEGGEAAVVSWWKGEGSLIDLFNPEAVEWMEELMQPVLDMGIDGWKCDGLDFSAHFAPYSPGAGREVERLEYSHAYYREFFEHTREVLGDDRLITARPIDNYGADLGGDSVAFAPIDINWAGWVGDQDATFDGLRAALLNMRHSSEYGYVAFGSDIGGYRDDDSELGRTSELLLRWAQVGATNPIMENGGGGIHHPWAFDEETTEIYRGLVELHHAIIPYLNEQGAVAFEAGESLMNFTDIREYQYFLGSDIFVAPVLEEGGAVSLTLPSANGNWVDAYSGTVHAPGEKIEATWPTSSFPLYFLEGSEVGEAISGVTGI